MKQLTIKAGKLILSVLKVIGSLFYNDAYRHANEVRPYAFRDWD